ncbi:hypothetical protein DIPPA_27863 [Diplonema papillatum]|nr:hypothetical protein DIPPA_27863 [Diplonema papillatum]KAJ9446098.1 hypothetical protein DIPPA_27863 [Diplonema papillatum]
MNAAAVREHLRSCMQDCDCAKLEDGIRRARGFVERYDPLLVKAETVLGQWHQECGRPRVLLLEAVTNRCDLLTIMKCIEEAEGHPARRMMKTDLRRAKQLVVETEKAMSTIKPVLASGSADRITSFLNDYGEVLPEEVYQEVATIRDHCLRGSSARRSRSPAQRRGPVRYGDRSIHEPEVSPVRGRIQAEFEGFVHSSTGGLQGTVTSGTIDVAGPELDRHRQLGDSHSRRHTPQMTPPPGNRASVYSPKGGHPGSRDWVTPPKPSPSPYAYRATGGSVQRDVQYGGVQPAHVTPAVYSPYSQSPASVYDDPHHTDCLRLYLLEISCRERVMKEERRACQVIIKEMLHDLNANRTLRVPMRAAPHARAAARSTTPAWPAAAAAPQQSPIPPLHPSRGRPSDSASVRSHTYGTPQYTPEYEVQVPFSPLRLTQAKNLPEEEAKIRREQERREEAERTEREAAHARRVADLLAEEGEAIRIIVLHEVETRESLSQLEAAGRTQTVLFSNAKADIVHYERYERSTISAEEDQERQTLDIKQSYKPHSIEDAGHDRLVQLQREGDRVKTIEAKLLETEHRVKAAMEPSIASLRQDVRAIEENILASVSRLETSMSPPQQDAEPTTPSAASTLKEEITRLQEHHKLAEEALTARAELAQREVATLQEQLASLQQKNQHQHPLEAELQTLTEQKKDLEAQLTQANQRTKEKAEERAQLVEELRAARDELKKMRTGQTPVPSLEQFIRGATGMIMDEQRGRFSIWEKEHGDRSSEEVTLFRMLQALHNTIQLAAVDEPAARGVIVTEELSSMSGLEQSPEIKQLFSLLEDLASQAGGESIADLDEFDDIIDV